MMTRLKRLPTTEIPRMHQTRMSEALLKRSAIWLSFKAIVIVLIPSQDLGI